MSEQAELSGPDLSAGIPFSSIPDGGMLGGHASGQPVIIARRGEEVFAIGGACTHYGAPLADGLVVGESVRCPWHHACFSLRTGEATCAPALNPVSVWDVERKGDNVRVTREIPAADGATPVARPSVRSPAPERIVIVGGGAAGNAAAEMLRREGYSGSLTMITADSSVPYDRPNLSKDYLAGNAQEEWIPLRAPEFYEQHGIELLRERRVTALDTTSRTVKLDTGESRSFDRLLLATGAEPVRLPIPGADLPHVHYLRTLDDSRAIIAHLASARNAVVLGASFIGLEVAASLRTRGLQVHVVAPESLPLERILGRDLGAFIRGLHEEKGVTFHLERTATSIDPAQVTLSSGEVIPADIVVIGVGVRPETGLAESGGLATDKGVLVNEYLETSSEGIFAAGDIARYPDPRGGGRIRVEHWVVAERQGQTAARNILGRRDVFNAVPFFWSNHYDASIRYVGHAERWDETRIDGNLGDGDATVAFRRDDRTLAVATVGRELESLRAEAALENSDWSALDSLAKPRALR